MPTLRGCGSSSARKRRERVGERAGRLDPGSVPGAREHAQVGAGKRGDEGVDRPRRAGILLAVEHEHRQVEVAGSSPPGRLRARSWSRSTIVRLASMFTSNGAAGDLGRQVEGARPVGEVRGPDERPPLDLLGRVRLGRFERVAARPLRVGEAPIDLGVEGRVPRPTDPGARHVQQRPRSLGVGERGVEGERGAVGVPGDDPPVDRRGGRGSSRGRRRCGRPRTGRRGRTGRSPAAPSGWPRCPSGSSAASGSSSSHRPGPPWHSTIGVGAVGAGSRVDRHPEPDAVVGGDHELLHVAHPTEAPDGAGRRARPPGEPDRGAASVGGTLGAGARPAPAAARARRLAPVRRRPTAAPGRIIVRLSKHHGLGNDFLVVLDARNDDAARRRRRPGAHAVRSAAGHRRGRADPRGAADRRAGRRRHRRRHAPVQLRRIAGRDQRQRHPLPGPGRRPRRGASPTRWCASPPTPAAGRWPSPPTDDPATCQVRVDMGAAAPGTARARAGRASSSTGRHGTVDMGNPHLVVLVDDPATVDLATEGAWLEAQFAGGVNVEYIARRATAAPPSTCGSGSAAPASPRPAGPAPAPRPTWPTSGASSATGSGWRCPAARADVELVDGDADPHRSVGARRRHRPGDRGGARMTEPDRPTSRRRRRSTTASTTTRPDGWPTTPTTVLDLERGRRRHRRSARADLGGTTTSTTSMRRPRVSMATTVRRRRCSTTVVEDDETHRGAFGDFGGDLRRAHRADLPRAHRARRASTTTAGRRGAHRAVARRAGPAGRHRRRRRRRPRRAAPPHARIPATFIGKGKVEELRELCEVLDADTVVFDDELTPGPAVQPREGPRAGRPSTAPR